MSSTQKWLTLGLLCAGLSAGALSLLSRATGALAWLEHPSVDARFALRGSIPLSKEVVVVALDTRSYRNLPLPPLPRTLDARLVEHLNDAGANVIAFDFALERPSADALADHELVQALARARRAVASVTAIEIDGGTAPLAGRVPFADTDVRPGVTLLPLDGDGAIRRFPAGLGGIASFALAAAGAAAPSLPARAPAGSLIDYPGPPGTVPALSFMNVLHGRFDPRLVRRKVVVVGPTAPVLQDIHRTPVGAAMPGAEIQADAVATAIDGFPLREASPTSTTALLLALSLVVILLALLLGWVPRVIRRTDPSPLDAFPLGRLTVLAAGAMTLVGWCLATQIAFDDGTVLDFADGLLAIICATVLAWTAAAALERRERRRLRLLFAASAPEVVARVLQDSEGAGSLLTPRAVIAGYEIEEQIGHGGMGVVYRAMQLHLERPVALKLIKPELAGSPRYRALFERESKLAAAVTHPNIVPVLDAGEDTGLLYIAMHFIEGVDLAMLLSTVGCVGPLDTARLVRQIGGALDAAHRLGLVHRDVKPANIVLRLEDLNYPFLTDFGLAKHINAATGHTQLEGWAGTIDYLAPEQIEGHRVDHRADIYALTAVLYHCLTGTLPFPRDGTPAKMWAHINAPRPSATALRPDLPPAIDLVIAKGLAVDPDDRHASARELAEDVCNALGLADGPAALTSSDAQWPGAGLSEHAPTHVVALEGSQPSEGPHES